MKQMIQVIDPTRGGMIASDGGDATGNWSKSYRKIHSQYDPRTLGNIILTGKSFSLLIVVLVTQEVIAGEINSTPFQRLVRDQLNRNMG